MSSSVVDSQLGCVAYCQHIAETETEKITIKNNAKNITNNKSTDFPTLCQWIKSLIKLYKHEVGIPNQKQKNYLIFCSFILFQFVKNLLEVLTLKT
jgi:uncharacterized protein (UPF0335 family)